MKHADDGATTLSCRLDDDGFHVEVLKNAKNLAQATELAFAAGDLTGELADFLAGIFEALHGIDLRATPASWTRLWDAAEQARKTLAAESSAPIMERDLARTGTGVANLEVEVQREKYESLVQPLLERAEACIDRTLAKAGIEASLVHRIELRGEAADEPLLVALLNDKLPSASLPLTAVSESLGAGGHTPEEPPDDYRETAATPSDSAFAHLAERTRTLLPQLHPDDRNEATAILERLQQAEAEGNQETQKSEAAALDDLLFFIVG